MLVQAEVEIVPALRKNRQAIAMARKAAQAGARESKRIVHVRSGDLKRSIKVQRTETGWIWGSDLYYAPYHEAEFPFIRPAIPVAAAAMQSISPARRRSSSRSV